METIKKYLLQKSTWFGLFKVFAALGVVSLAPDVEEQVVNYAIDIATGVFGAWGVYNVIKDESKDD